MSPRARIIVRVATCLLVVVATAGCGGGGGGGASSNAALASLECSAGTLIPAFDPETLAYAAGPEGLTNVETMTMTPTAEDAGATITVNGESVATGEASPEIPLPLGTTVVEVVVTAPDGTTRTYAVTFVREPPPSTNLSSLVASDGTLTPAFDPDVYTYTVGPEGLLDVSQITFRPTAVEDGATITVNGQAVLSGAVSQAIDIPVGATQPTATPVYVVVSLPDGSTRVYTFIFTRPSYADLAGLTVSAGVLTPVFAPQTFAYAAGPSGLTTVPSVTVTPTAAQAGATITVDGTVVASGTPSQAIPLPAGATTATVVVTGADTTTRTYTVVFTKSVSSNPNLSALTVSAGTLTPAFSQSTITYAVGPTGLLSVGAVTVTPTAADVGASITVAGTAVTSGTASQAIPLSVAANPVLIVVTAADGVTTKSYTVVFTRSAPTAQQAYVKASNTETYDGLCYVAISGDTLVVGAEAEDSNATGVNGTQSDNSAGNAGAAYVFVRSGTTWTQQAYLKASNTEAGDLFGCHVAISGNTIVVGAYGEDSSATGVNGTQSNNSASSSGAAYVFVRSGTTWTQQAYLKASNTANGDFFGISVAIDNNTVVVGAQYEDSNATGVNGSQTNNSANASGAAYVFTRSGTTWTQQAYLKASNTGASDELGYDVGVSGNTIIVGAHHEDSSATGVNGTQSDNSAGDAGAAYVFVRSGTTWTQQAYLKASNTGAGDNFGWDVSVSGDTVVVGALNEDSSATGVNGTQSDNSAGDSGAAYVFTRSGTTWTQQAYLKASNTGAGDGFGAGVAVCGDAIVCAAVFEDSNATGLNGTQTNNSTTASGAVYLFTRTGTTWTQQTYMKASNTGAGDGMGARVVALDGDTFVAGARNEDSSATGVNGTQTNNSATDSGAAYVIR